MPGWAANVPVFVFTKIPKKIFTPPYALCPQNLDLCLRCTQTNEHRSPLCETFKELLQKFIITGSDITPYRCAPGYYGNPMVIGNSCKRCDCNGNSDPNLIFNECHNVTGNCQHCWGNTAGANCERCAPGFYGDAISAKNCRGGSNKWLPIILTFLQEIFNIYLHESKS